MFCRYDRDTYSVFTEDRAKARGVATLTSLRALRLRSAIEHVFVFRVNKLLEVIPDWQSEHVSIPVCQHRIQLVNIQEEMNESESKHQTLQTLHFTTSTVEHNSNAGLSLVITELGNRLDIRLPSLACSSR